MKPENMERLSLNPQISAKVSSADFETAISASGFGKFNILLFLVAIPAGWAAVFEVTTMSYVFPAAECDLNLTLDDKGILNAITFAGMVTTGFIWGFLCDSLGRKRLLTVCFLLDALFVVASSLSQNVTVLIVSKFLGGTISNGPAAALTAYISEFHGYKHRSKIQMLRGIIVSCGSMVLPLLAWAILPLNINLRVFNYFAFSSWNLYLLLSAIPSLFGGLAFIFMPESPKFLMSIGENKKALNVFKQVFRMNTGISSENYPVKKLMNEVDGSDSKFTIRSHLQAMKEELGHIKLLFQTPHCQNVILVCSIQMLNKASLSPLKLWLPQIFQAINDYKMLHNGTTTRLCTMLEELEPSNSTSITYCEVNVENSFVYVNTMVAAMVAIVGYVLAGTIIEKVGEKRLLITLGALSGICSVMIYHASDTASTLTLTSATTALGSICSNALLAIVIELFPTRLRTTTIALLMMVGKAASMVGNLLFPILLEMGCAPPFLSIGVAVIGCSILSIILPQTEYKPLE